MIIQAFICMFHSAASSFLLFAFTSNNRIPANVRAHDENMPDCLVFIVFQSFFMSYVNCIRSQSTTTNETKRLYELFGSIGLDIEVAGAPWVDTTTTATKNTIFYMF